MKKRTRRLLAALMSGVMLISLTCSAMAEEPPAMPGGDMMGAPPDGGMPGGMPPGGPGGGGGGGGGGQEFATFEEVWSHAGIQVENGQVYTNALEGYAALNGSDFGGTIELAEGGNLTLAGASGLNLTTGGVIGNGIALDLEQETDRFVIGGDETYYTVDGKEYNSVIKVEAGSGNNDAGYEAVYGVGIGLNTGEVWVRNSYLSSEGARSTPIYAFSTAIPDATALVVENSTLQAYSDNIWMPPFKLLAGGARATLLATLNNSWFYGATVLANNWGAISQDSVDAYTYVVNTLGKATEGGYGTYLTYGMRLYGSELYAGQYGIFMCGNSDIITDTGAAALEDEVMMSKIPDYPVDTTAGTIVAAPVNAIVVHNSLPDATMIAKGEFRNTTLSTLVEDLPDDVNVMESDDEFFVPGVDILGSGKGCGASYFYTENLFGSLALIRSMNADFTFDNVDARTSNGVLLQSVVTYDPPSAVGYLTPDQSNTVLGVKATFRNGSYEGDILHEDYQRAMTVLVDANATLTGKVVSGTWAAWNNKWTEETMTAVLAEDGYTPDLFNNPDWVADVQANLVRAEDTVYADTENVGVALTVANSGTWIVDDTSTLSSLTIEANGTVKAPEGYTLTAYQNCGTSNSALTYDYTVGTEVELTAGTYEDVVIVVTAAGAQPEQPAEPAPEAPAQPEVTTYTVVANDTLWGIAQKFFGTGFKWNLIFEANRDVVKDANLIFVGQKLVIPAP